jgi:hypothetical protein
VGDAVFAWYWLNPEIHHTKKDGPLVPASVFAFVFQMVCVCGTCRVATKCPAGWNDFVTLLMVCYILQGAMRLSLLNNMHGKRGGLLAKQAAAPAPTGVQ